jgi:hypothetical protein
MSTLLIATNATTTTTTTTKTESTTNHLSIVTSTQATDQSVATVQSLAITSPSETILELESSTTLSVVAETSSIPPSSGDLYVLIGGIIGGIIALVLVLAVIASCVVRSRRRRPTPQQPTDNHDATAASTVDIFRNAGENNEYASFNYDDEVHMVVYADAPTVTASAHFCARSNARCGDTSL